MHNDFSKFTQAPVFITTPIYYVNDTPHIGHAYTTIVADVLVRYRKLFGQDCLFLTGTDEHGQKIQAAAQKRGKTPQAHCDEMVENFKSIWKELKIENDIFFRTTDPHHKKIVQRCLQKLFDQGEIYLESYEGWYCESEEIFYTEKDLVNGKTPLGNDVQKIVESNYFFKMSKYQARLIEEIEKNPSMIEPVSRRNEVLGFLKKPLEDLCISRPKKRLSWGIELPFDSEFVTYVWFDALLNYAVAVGIEQPEKEKEFKKWWGPPGGAIHLIGKDILTTHTVYWTTMLMALGAPLPKMVFAHGWWLTQDNEKMSKSKGRVVRPLDLKNIVGVEPMRYFLVRDIVFGSDAQFSQQLVLSRVNSELSNNLGNLFSRCASLIQKYFNGSLPKASLTLDEKPIEDAYRALALKVAEHIFEMRPQAAVGEVVDFLTLVNQYVDAQAPWKLAKENMERAGTVLRVVCESLRLAAVLLSPILPSKMEELLNRLGTTPPKSPSEISHWMGLADSTQVKSGDPLFPRVELPKEQ